MLVDRKFRLARMWSNAELRKIAPIFSGDVVNVSAWDDRDKMGGNYKDYFVNAESYSYTNIDGYKGFQGSANEHLLDLEGHLPEWLHSKFDVAFNHTTLEHIWDVQAAFRNICELSKDIVIIVVPFSQVQHEGYSWGDYWRFTPTCIRKLFYENGFEVIYEAENRHKNAAIYLLLVGSRYPERWSSRMPSFRPIANAGSVIGYNICRQVLLHLLRRIKGVA